MADTSPLKLISFFALGLAVWLLSQRGIIPESAAMVLLMIWVLALRKQVLPQPEEIAATRFAGEGEAGEEAEAAPAEAAAAAQKAAAAAAGSKKAR